MNYYIELLASEQGIPFQKAKALFLSKDAAWRSRFIIGHVPNLHSLNSSGEVIFAAL